MSDHRLTAKMAAGVFLAAFILLLTACAKEPKVELSVPLPSVETLQGRLAAATSQYDSLKGFARIEYRGNGEKKSADHVLFAQYPDKLRIETLGLFGSPAMLAATDGKNATVLLPGEGVAYVGADSTGFLGRITGLPLTPEMVVSIMLRRPELFESDHADVVALENGGSRLTRKSSRNSRLSQTVDFDHSLNIVKVTYLADGRPVSVIDYAGYVDDFPGRVELHLINADLQVSIRFDDVESNVALADALFRLVPSTGYNILPFPER